MATVHQVYQMRDMEKVLASFEAQNPDATVLTYGQIFRQETSQAGITVLESWIAGLSKDRRRIAKMARSRQWSEGELNALRALYNSRTNQINQCHQAVIMIRALLEAYETIEERIDRYSRTMAEGCIHEDLPF